MNPDPFGSRLLANLSPSALPQDLQPKQVLKYYKLVNGHSVDCTIWIFHDESALVQDDDGTTIIEFRDDIIQEVTRHAEQNGFVPVSTDSKS